MRTILAIAMLASLAVPVREARADARALARDFVAAFAAHDLERLATLAHPDIEWYTVEGGELHPQSAGRQALLDGLEGYFEGCPSCRSRAQVGPANARFATLLEFANWDAAGGPREQSSAAVLEFEDGLLRRAWYHAAVEEEPVEPPPLPELPPDVDLPPHARKVLRDYEAAWAAGDEVALAALFTPDGWVLSSGRPPVHGREAITARYENSGGPLALRGFHYEEHGDLAVLLGGYARAAGQPDIGKFTLVLRRTAEGWRIVSDMDNGNGN